MWAAWEYRSSSSSSSSPGGRFPGTVVVVGVERHPADDVLGLDALLRVLHAVKVDETRLPDLPSFPGQQFHFLHVPEFPEVFQQNLALHSLRDLTDVNVPRHVPVVGGRGGGEGGGTMCRGCT